MSAFPSKEITNAINRIKSSKVLPPPPALPVYCGENNQMSPAERLGQIQKYIEEFEYNYSGKPFFRMWRNGGSFHVKSVANEIMTTGLPIQCVEAVFIAALLTSEMEDITRIPLNFKSKFKGESVHRHIVMAVKANGKWGAVGLSRRSCLMYKPLSFNSLFALIMDFKSSYNSVLHSMDAVYLGLPLPRDFSLVDRKVTWKHLKINIRLNNLDKVEQTLQQYCALINV